LCFVNGIDAINVAGFGYEVRVEINPEVIHSITGIFFADSDAEVSVKPFRQGGAQFVARFGFGLGDDAGAPANGAFGGIAEREVMVFMFSLKS
jgi:hypothetical protein